MNEIIYQNNNISIRRSSEENQYVIIINSNLYYTFPKRVLKEIRKSAGEDDIKKILSSINSHLNLTLETQKVEQSDVYTALINAGKYESRKTRSLESSLSR